MIIGVGGGQKKHWLLGWLGLAPLALGWYASEKKDRGGRKREEVDMTEVKGMGQRARGRERKERGRRKKEGAMKSKRGAGRRKG